MGFNGFTKVLVGFGRDLNGLQTRFYWGMS